MLHSRAVAKDYKFKEWNDEMEDGQHVFELRKVVDRNGRVTFKCVKSWDDVWDVKCEKGVSKQWPIMHMPCFIPSVLMIIWHMSCTPSTCTQKCHAPHRKQSGLGVHTLLHSFAASCFILGVAFVFVV